MMNQQQALFRLQRNLETAQERLAIVKEQHLLSLAMLAEQICREEGTAEELFDTFLSDIKEPNEWAKAVFCRTYAGLHAKDPSLRPESLLSMRDLAPAGAHGKIAFVRNRYNERAYDRFSELVIGTKPIYVSDFTEACESVYNGQSNYCILPIENSTGGRLFSFYAMMDRYDLKICAAAEIESDDGAENVRYALVGHSVPRPLGKSATCVLECSLTREDGTAISDLLQAAELLGARVQTIDFLPLEYDYSFYRVFLSFVLPLDTVAAFALYLSLSYPNYNPIGFYKI